MAKASSEKMYDQWKGAIEKMYEEWAEVGVTKAPMRLGPIGDDATIVCNAGEDMARQEYALSSDLAYQVQRFGVGQFKGQYGEQDLSLLDATTAFEIVRESQERWLSLPKVLRDRYQSWANIEAAAASGELEQVLKAAGVSTAVVEAPVASPSESAAGEGAKPPKGS